MSEISIQEKAAVDDNDEPTDEDPGNLILY
jgi:hypothetical protein